MFNFVLAVFLLLSPIIIFPLNGIVAKLQFYQFGGFSGSGNLLQLQFFQYGAILLFLTALFSKPKREFNNKYLGLLFGVYLWSVVCHPKTMESFFTVLCGFIIYYLVVVYASKSKMFLWIIFSVSALNTLFAILQSCGINLIYMPNTLIRGLMSYKIHLGIYQAIAVPIAYSLNPVLAVIPMIGLVLSKSWTSIMALIIGVGYLVKVKNKKIIIPLVAICALGVKLFLFSKFLSRWCVWKELPSLMIKNIYGYGVGTFNHIGHVCNMCNMCNRVLFTDFYNLYFDILYALGLLGLAAIIFFGKDSLSNNKRDGVFGSCLVFAVVGLGYTFFGFARLAGTAIVLFALLEVGKKEVYRERKICRP